MKRRETFDEAFANVDDQFIMAAMTPPRRRRRVWMPIGVVAACLAIVIGAYFPIRNAILNGKYQQGAVIVDTEKKDDPLIDFNFGAQEPSAPPLPWDNTLYLRGETATCSYQPGSKVELHFEIGLKDNVLGGGAFRLAVNAPDFQIDVEGYECKDGVVIVDHAGPDRYSLEQPLKIKLILTPTYTEAYAMGTISLSVGFVPDDAEAFRDKIEASNVPENYSDWQTIFFDGDALRLKQAAVDYAADRVELILDTEPMGAVDTWEVMIARHYKTGKISAEEFANMYYHWAYRNKIYASVDSYMTKEHTVRFSYMSQNIRYTQTNYVDASEIWARYEKVQAFEQGDWENYNSAEAAAARRSLAECILLYMKEQGIITPEEYESELAFMAATKNVGNWGVGYDQNIAPYARKIEKYMYTH